MINKLQMSFAPGQVPLVLVVYVITADAVVVVANVFALGRWRTGGVGGGGGGSLFSPLIALVGWSVGRSVGYLVGWLVYWLVWFGLV